MKHARISIGHSALCKWWALATADIMKKLDINLSEFKYRCTKRNPNRYFKNNLGFEFTYNPNVEVIVHDMNKLMLFKLKHSL